MLKLYRFPSKTILIKLKFIKLPSNPSKFHKISWNIM
jgi:hypothetical protein